MISVIVPTIGRPDSLSRLLTSLASQTMLPAEVIIADGSDDQAVKDLIHTQKWSEPDLHVHWVAVHPPNAVKQRQTAIDLSKGDLLLFLDDDVELEPQCIEQLCDPLLGHDDIVATMADFNNQEWPQPTFAWRIYMLVFHGLINNAWQGKVIGPLLRFGYHSPPEKPVQVEWLGTCNSLVRRSAYDLVGGFSDFFLHRCTINEDVDLGLKLAKVGRILFCPAARMSHFHAPGGRVSPPQAAEDDLYNRFMVLHKTAGNSWFKSLVWVFLFFSVESSSILIGSLRRFNFRGFYPQFVGRLRAFGRIFSSRMMSP